MEKGGPKGHPRPGRNFARRHPRHERRPGHPDRDGRHDLARRRGRAPDGQAGRRRLRRPEDQRGEKALRRRRPDLQRGRVGLDRRRRPARSWPARSRPGRPRSSRSSAARRRPKSRPCISISASSSPGPTRCGSSSVRANSDTPVDARTAFAFGAQGIGLARTEHMFFGPERLPIVKEMIMADNEADRRAALDKLLPFQRKDFYEFFKEMHGNPVTIRTIDPPLHEFLPRREDLMVELARAQGSMPRKNKARIAELEALLERVKASSASSTRCSATAAAGWASPIPRSPRCRPGPSSRRPASWPRKARRSFRRSWCRSSAP